MKPGAVGYVRVSTPDQAQSDKTSPEQQRQSIKKYIKDQGWKFVGFYEDLGISGGSMVGRKGLQTLLDDALEGKFEKVVCHKIDRFGRDARDYKNNRYELERAGVDFISVTEPSADDSYNSDFVDGIRAEIAELEKQKIKERTLGGRRGRLLKGGAPLGKLQFGRYYKYTTELGKKQRRIYEGGPCGNGIHLDPKAVKKMELVYDLACKGERFIKIAKVVQIRYENLIDIIRRQCGSTWTITFKPQKKFTDMKEPVTQTLKQPALLLPDKVKRLNAIMDANVRMRKREDVQLFPLSGILRCTKCNRSFTGQRMGGGTKYEQHYYRHPRPTPKDIYNGNEPCREFTSIKAVEIEDRIFKMLFDVSYDRIGFEEATREGLPDAKYLTVLRGEIDQKEKELKRVNADLNKLVDIALAGTLKENVIKGKQDELLVIKDRLVPELEELKTKFNSLPKVEDVRLEAELIRADLMAFFASKDRLKDMGYRDKRRMLRDLFQDGGIYLSKGDNGSVNIDMKAGLRVAMLNQVKADMKIVEGLKKGVLASNNIHKSDRVVLE